MCNPATGTCSNPNAPDTTTACSLANACTTNDHCVSGTCTSTCGATGTSITCSAAKFTGGGQFRYPTALGDKWSFGFNAQGTMGAPKGHFNAVNHSGGHINGDVTAITCINDGTSMTFVVTDGGCLYTVTVTDGGTPGTGTPGDTISISGSGVCVSASSTPNLTAGNIQGH